MGGPARRHATPPLFNSRPSSQRSESRPLKATARADRRPVTGAEATRDIVRGCPPKGSPNGPKKQGAPEQNTGAAPRRTRPRRAPGRRRRAAQAATKKHSKDAGRRLEGQRRLRQRPRLRRWEIQSRRDPGPDRFSNTDGRRPPLARARSQRWPERWSRRRLRATRPLDTLQEPRTTRVAGRLVLPFVWLRAQSQGCAWPPCRLHRRRAVLRVVER